MRIHTDKDRGGAGSRKAIAPGVPSTKLQSPAEVGDVLGVGRQTVLNYYHAGVIPAAVHVGNTIRFDIDEVKATLKKRAAQ